MLQFVEVAYQLSPSPTVNTLCLQYKDHHIIVVWGLIIVCAEKHTVPCKQASTNPKKSMRQLQFLGARLVT